jgi:hypothetical protein
MAGESEGPSVSSRIPAEPASELPTPPGAGEAALALAETEEVLEDLQKVRKKKRRHALWAFLGFSPAAVVPAVGLLMEGSLGLLIVFSLIVSTTQLVGWSLASERERELEELLSRLEKEV